MATLRYQRNPPPFPLLRVSHSVRPGDVVPVTDRTFPMSGGVVYIVGGASNHSGRVPRAKPLHLK